ncbi:MAG: BatD family protein [Chloroflexota bacterium]|nr:BatD family protein [Chloroflexota bacterium]
MSKTKRSMILVVGLLILGLVAIPGYAQGPDVITATVDRTDLTTDEWLTLTVAISGRENSAAQPSLPALDGFQFAGSSSGTQISMVNGATSFQTVYNYRLRPERTGTLVIDPVTVVVNGQPVSTDPISVQVSQGTGQVQQPGSARSALPGGGMDPFDLFNMDPFDLLNSFGAGGMMPSRAPSTASLQFVPAPAELVGQDYYAEAVIDNPAPYQGEQVTYTVRFYRAVEPLGQTSFDAPSFTGFWSSAQPEQQDFRTDAAGRAYRMTELKTILFPTLIGETTIDPATLTVPGGFSNRGQTLQTQPVAVEVQALPAGAPAGFQGAVGKFGIQSEVDRTETQVGDAITLRITLAGQGNIDTVSQLNWPEFEGWRAFKSESQVDSWLEEENLVGVRAFERVLVPTTAGSLSLPAIDFSYFDLDAGEYRTISTDAIAVDVTPDGSVDNFGQTPVISGGAGEAVLINNDLRPLKVASEIGDGANLPLAVRPGYWLLWIVPLAMLAGQFIWQKRESSMFANAAAYRSRKAATRAHKALQDSRTEKIGRDIVVERILTTYIAEKLNKPVTGLTHDEIAELLQEQGVDPGLIARVLTCLAAGETSRYAPHSAITANGDLPAEADQLIDLLEQAL